MILSNELLISDDQAITATAISTNVIDTGAPGTPYDAVRPLNHDTGDGTEVPLLVQVTEDFNNLTSLTVAVETGTAETLGTVVTQQTFTLAELQAGARLNVRTLPDGIQRYLGCRYTVVGTAPTTGRITSAIVAGVQTNVTGP